MEEVESDNVLTSRVRETSLDAAWKDSIDGATLDFTHKHEQSKHLNCWTKLPESNELSVCLSRFKHSAVAWKDCLYVFGGCSYCNSDVSLNDTVVYNFTTRTWKTVAPKTTKPPSPRYSHSAVVHQNSMIIFGGFSNLMNKNDVFQYRFDLEQWTPWLHIQGELPNARAAHSAFIYDNKMWIFAGYDGKNKLNDMWNLSLEPNQQKWVKVPQNGDQPPGCFNSACDIVDDHLYGFSGQAGANITNHLVSFNLRTFTWSRVMPDLINNNYRAPRRRYGHTMVCHEKKLFVFGGQTNDLLPNDLYCFDTVASRWEIVKPNKLSQNIPSCRSYHCATMIDNLMVVSGGTKSDKKNGNLYCFSFASLPSSTLREDLEALLDSQELCDLDFNVGSGENCTTLSGHLAIVTARSPYIKMLALDKINETRQEPANSSEMGYISDEKLALDFPQISPNAFKIVLKFIYTDRIPPPVSSEVNSIITLTDVYSISAQFQLSRLEKICIIYIQSFVNKNNVLSALQMAVSRNLAELVEVFQNFIVDNFSTIILHPDFEELDKDLIIQLVRRKESAGTIRVNPGLNESIHTSLEEDLKSLMEDTQLTDFVLTVGEYRTPVHRTILAARCQYFRSMFRSMPPVNRSVSIKIGDLEPTLDAFKSLLRFIYCNDTDMKPEDSLYLFTADKFYGFTNNQLQCYCKENLEMNIDTSNVLVILRACEEISCKDMKRHALQIIAQNFPVVQASSGFRNLSKPLLLEVCDHVSMQMQKLKQG